MRDGRPGWSGKRARASVTASGSLIRCGKRLAAPSRYPLDVADLSLVEKLAFTLLPEPLRPAGLPPEAVIWAEFEALRDGKRG